ncbi:MAG: hypothetical protein ACT4QC_15335 [Planctomycetaceae bacterium]
MAATLRIAVVGGLVVVLGLWIANSASNAKDEAAAPDKSETQVKPGFRKTAMKMFMRKKLAASQDVLEGLALEDFDLIEKGAKQLKALAVAAEFMVVNDPLYAEYADDFRRTANKMEKAAKERRIDGATLGYMDTTMNCVECHKFVRTIQIAR